MDSRLAAGVIIALIIGVAVGYGASYARGPATATVTVTRPTTTTVTSMSTVTRSSTYTTTATYTATTTAPCKAEYNVRLAYKPGIGLYLVDKDGRTLYFFAKDYDGKSKCYGACAEKWPIFYVEDVKPSPGLSKSDFGVIVREDGSRQATYKGWPLYYFAGDKKPGDVNGDGVKGVWFVAKPDYTVMVAVKEGLGMYLVTDRGMTLYFFAKDTGGKSSCYGACAEKWPVYSPNRLVIPSTLNITDFHFILRNDGKVQLVYKNRLLYLWVGDKAMGDTTGQGVKNVWFVALVSGQLP